jgi:phospholipase C
MSTSWQGAQQWVDRRPRSRTLRRVSYADREGQGYSLTRRAMLVAGASAAASLTAGALPAWARAPLHRRPHRPRPGQLPRPDQPIGQPGIPNQVEHVVVLVMENHSADSVLGMLGQFAPTRRWYYDGLPVDRRGTPIASNLDRQGHPVRSFVMPDLCPASDGLTQNWNSSHHQFNNGRNDGFVTNANSIEPMGYLTPEQMPISYALASQFPVSDRYFCSVLGQTLPNRRYLFSATSSGQINDDNSSLLVPAANGTIFDRMDGAGVSWLVYYGNTPSPFYFPNFRQNPLQVARCVKNSQFFSDAAAGQLPAVSVVEPNFNFQSEENPQDIAYGEAFVRSVVSACFASPQWPKLALFYTYDEHGGYYDHVPPPRAVPPDDIPPDLTLSAKGTFPAAFDRYGFRVPFTVISPWAQPHYVSHQVADHTSILAFIEHRFNLAPLTRRDAAAWDLRDLFDTSQPHFERPPSLPAGPDVQATLDKCQSDGKSPPQDSLQNQLPAT